MNKNKVIIIGPPGQKKSNGETTNVQSTDLILQKLRAAKPRSFSHFWWSFVHALRWSQLKRRFQELSMKACLKKHGLKASALILLAIFLHQNDWNVQFAVGQHPAPIHQQASLIGSSGSSVDFDPTLQKDFEPAQRSNQPEEASIFLPPSIPDMGDQQSMKEELKEFTFKQDKRSSRYINRFIKVARSEHKKYNIPVSVTLGLALLNSNMGNNKLVKKGNNHLGVLQSKNLLTAGQEQNGYISFDGKRYQKYTTAWASFRAHSLYIKKQFEHLTQQKEIDYKVWAKALEKGGYENPNFSAENLITIIELYDLQSFDKKNK